MATAAGLAALSELTVDAYAAIESRAARLAAIIRTSLGTSATVSQVGTLVGVHLGDALGGRNPVNFSEAKTTDEPAYAKLFHALLNEGVALAPGAYEALFVGLSHDESVMDELSERFQRAVATIL
jgi:glutamate-1-semialdehyde 2,1-aminomutase